jgi:hypothetical protein
LEEKIQAIERRLDMNPNMSDRESNFSRVNFSGAHGKSKTWIAMQALTVIGLVVSAGLARAGSISATAGAGPSGTACTSATGAGGSGSSSANTGSVPCTTTSLFGDILGSLSSASGSWVTGDFAASTSVSATTDMDGHGYSIQGTGSDMFQDIGTVTLSGVSSAMITFGATGVSGSATGEGGAGDFSSGATIELEMIAGGSGGVTSIACLTYDLFITNCPGSGVGLVGSLGAGALAPITLTVTNGESLELDVMVNTTAYAASYATSVAMASLTVDPLYLSLPTGVTFNSGVTGFLSGSSTPSGGSSVPESASFVLLGAGLLGLGLLRRRGK